MSIVHEHRETFITSRSRTSLVDPPLKSRVSLLGGFAWTLLLASVAGFFACRTTATPTKRVAQKPIEQVRLLDRMAGTNPIRSDAESLPEPDPATSRVVKLQLHDDDSQLVEIEMVQSLKWLENFDAKIGNTIDLNLPEVGAVGEARVVSIEPCPPIPSGRGNLVTALFKHHAKQAINLHVANSAEPIGVTPNHPIWSEDRQTFVPAGQLHPGERLRTRTGETTTIISVLPRPGPEPVYNLQVHGEHVYQVGTSGLLVHNKAARVGETLEQTAGNLRINIWGAGEAPAFLDVALPGNWANGRVLTPSLASGSAAEILVRNAPVPIAEMKRLARPGTRISINQALEGSQADAVLSAFDGQYTVIRDVVLETNGVLHRILQIVIN